MIEKIVKIKSVGRFSNYSASGDVTLRKLSLVYAENGRGKTTLCAILRSLQTGRHEFISERKSLAATEPASVHLRIDGVSCRFTNNSWTATHSDIVIFDPVFVSNNVCSGDYVDHEHKKNLYRVIVGSEGVRLAGQIEEFDRQVRDVNSDLRAKRDSISRFMPTGTNLEEYLRWQSVIDIDNQIKQKTEQLISRQHIITKSSEIQLKNLLAKVSLPTIPSDFEIVLGKQLEDVVTDAEARVRNQITKHEMAHQGEPWLSQGFGYVRENSCPFCGQSLDANELMQAYRSHFSTAYGSLKQEVARLSQHVDTAIGEASLLSTQQTISDNAALAEFWKQFFEISLPALSFGDIQQRFSSLREQCLLLAKRKENSPTAPITANEEYSSALTAIQDLRESVNEYNASIDAANIEIDEQKTATRTNDDITSLTAELAQLEARKRRFESEVVEACQNYADAITAKASLEQSKETTRGQLDDYCIEILRTYEQSINEYLDQFNAGFRITNTRHLYTGGTPSSLYQIQINGTALDLGDTRTPSGTPCFKTALSSGDRGALAIAFFLATLKHDTNIANKIIIFDDPFTSLDRFRRTCTQQLIQRLSDSAKQVIVLSHDPYFLKLLWDECPTRDTSARVLQMSKAGETTVIGEWDIEAEVRSNYIQDYSILLSYYRDGSGGSRLVARTIRPFLEGMLRSHFPGHFQHNEWLGDFISKIRDAEPMSGLQHAKADLDELDAINSYSKKYHHDQNANAETEPINDDELQGFVKRTLRLVGGE